MLYRAVPITVILLVFIGLGITYNAYTPLWSPPDEELHFAYCQYIARNHCLPPLQSNAEEHRVSLAFHPPLYYIIGSLFCKSNDPAIQDLIVVDDGPGLNRIKHPQGENSVAASACRLRVFTLLLSAITLCCIYIMALTIFPGNTPLAAAAALFVGTNPQFIYVAASISNETIAVTLSTLYLLLLIRYATYNVSGREIFCTGIALGACLLAKTSTVFWLPVTLLVIAAASIHNTKKLFADCGIVFGIAALIAGWWYAINWSLLINMQTSQPWFIRHAPISIKYILKGITTTFMSFFGYFGALDIPIPDYYLGLYLVLLIIGLSGSCCFFLQKKITPPQYRACAILFIALLGGIAFFILLNKKYYAFQGKYFFVVIAPISIFTFLWIEALASRRVKNSILIIGSCLLIAIHFDIVFKILKPAYAEAAIKASIEQPAFSRIESPVAAVYSTGQTFIAPDANLCGIRIILSCPLKPQEGLLRFELIETNNKKIAASASISASDIEDAHYYYFTFPPIPESQGRQYTFSLISPQQEGATVFPWYETNDAYKGGHMIVNGKQYTGDICFSVYCFTGITPRLAWEGTQTAIINQGMYVTVRELQLYDSASSSLKQKTILGKKMTRYCRLLIKNKPDGIK